MARRSRPAIALALILVAGWPAWAREDPEKPWTSLPPAGCPARFGAEVACAFRNSGAFHALPFEAGERIRLSVRQMGTDVTLALFDPHGRRLLTVDSPNDDTGREPVVAVALVSGTYRLEVRGGSEGKVGRYRLALDEPEEAGPRERSLAEAARLLEQAWGLWKEAEELAPQAARAQLETARAHLAAARARWQDASDHQALALASLHEAEVARQLVRHAADPQAKRQEQDREQRALEAALTLYRCLGDDREVARAHFLLGFAAERRRAWLVARDAHREALALMPEDDLQLAARAHNNLGVVLNALGDHTGAVRSFFTAADLWVRRGNRARAAETLMSLGRDYVQQRRVVPAHQVLERAQRFVDPDDSSTDGRLRRFRLAVRFGQLAHAEGDLETALVRFRAALDEQPDEARFRASVQNALGNTLLGLGRLRQAGRAFVDARAGYTALGRPVDAAIVDLNLGQVDLARGRHRAAWSRFRAALSIFASHGHAQGRASAYRGLSLTARALGDAHTARQLAEAAVARVESIRESAASAAYRAAFLYRKRPYYESLVAMLVGEARVLPRAAAARRTLLDRALEVMEMMHARRLLDRLGGLGHGGADPPPELVAEESELVDAIEHARGRRRRAGEGRALAAHEVALRARLDLVQAELRTATVGAGAAGDGTTASAASIRQALGTDTTLLEVAAVEGRIVLLRADEAGVEAFDLGPRVELEGLARAAYRGLATGQPDALVAPLLRTLSARLLGPLGERVGGRRLAVVADGPLASVPWSLLVAADGRPLVTRHQVVRLPSASALLMVRGRRRGRAVAETSIAIVADPVFGPDDARLPMGEHPDPGPPVLERLPATRTEAEAIAALYATGDALVALGFDATASLLTDGALAPVRILHLAVHGEVAPGAAELPSLTFSRFDRDGHLVADPVLSADEIARLRLDAELVVLSACSTSRVAATSGDGIASLALAVFHAGVPRLVGSLWDVPDMATASLMIAFHRAVARGVAPAEALRRAQAALFESGAAASDWAGFVFEGDWRPLEVSPSP